MDEFFRNIKSVGFDLDNTLYPSNEEISNRIIGNFAKVVLENDPSLEDIEAAIEFFEERYTEIGSRMQILRELGFSNPRSVAEKCMETAKFLDLLKYDEEIVSILERIKSKYNTFLITGSNRDLSIPRLEKLRIPLSLFNYVVFGDNPERNKKIDGSIYRYFLEQSNYHASQHVYIGDNLRGDIIPPKSLGMKTIAIGKEMKDADFSVDKIYDIEKLLL